MFLCQCLVMVIINIHQLDSRNATGESAPNSEDMRQWDTDKTRTVRTCQAVLQATPVSVSWNAGNTWHLQEVSFLVDLHMLNLKFSTVFPEPLQWRSSLCNNVKLTGKFSAICKLTWKLPSRQPVQSQSIPSTAQTACVQLALLLYFFWNFVFLPVILQTVPKWAHQWHLGSLKITTKSKGLNHRQLTDTLWFKMNLPVQTMVLVCWRCAFLPC